MNRFSSLTEVIIINCNLLVMPKFFQVNNLIIITVTNIKPVSEAHNNKQTSHSAQKGICGECAISLNALAINNQDNVKFSLSTLPC